MNGVELLKTEMLYEQVRRGIQRRRCSRFGGYVGAKKEDGVELKSTMKQGIQFFYDLSDRCQLIDTANLLRGFLNSIGRRQRRRRPAAWYTASARVDREPEMRSTRVRDWDHS